jgi:integrase/recombinase XerD
MMGELRDQMLMDLQLSGAKPRTQETHLREVKNLAKYFIRSPAELGETELKKYILHMINERHSSEGAFRTNLQSLLIRFMIHVTPVFGVKRQRCKKRMEFFEQQCFIFHGADHLPE